MPSIMWQMSSWYSRLESSCFRKIVLKTLYFVHRTLFMNIRQLKITKAIFFYQISHMKYIFRFFSRKLVTCCLTVHLNDYFHLKSTNDIFEFLFQETKYAYQINDSLSSRCPHQKLMTNFKWIFMIFHSYILYK